MKSLKMIVISCFIASAGSLMAMEGRFQEEEENEKTLLLNCLEAFEKSGELLLKGTVNQKEAGDGTGGMTRMIVIGGGGSGGGEAFSGAIEAWRSGKDEWVLVSTEALPGIGFFDNGERTITQVIFEGSPADTAELTGDLLGLLDLHALIKSLKKTDIEVMEGEEEESFVFKGKISKRIVQRGGGSPFQIMAPQVLRVEAEITVKKGSLAAMKFTVVRSDPLAHIKRQALEGDMDGGANISMGMPEESKEEGKSTIYTFKPVKGKPSERAKKFRDQIHWILKNEIL